MGFLIQFTILSLDPVSENVSLNSQRFAPLSTFPLTSIEVKPFLLSSFCLLSENELKLIPFGVAELLLKSPKFNSSDFSEIPSDAANRSVGRTTSLPNPNVFLTPSGLCGPLLSTLKLKEVSLS